MAGCEFSNIPDLDDVKVAGNNVLIRALLRGQEDDLGTVAAGPGSLGFSITVPVGPEGDLPLLRLAQVATTDRWKSNLDEEDQWPKAKIVLDNSNGWTVTYDGTRALIDGWRLQPAADGNGYEEVINIRMFRVERRRNEQHPIPLRTDGKPKK